MPGGGRLDPLGQAVHPRLGPGAAGVPEPGAQRVGGALGSSARTEAPTLWMLSASRWNWAARPSSRPSSRSAAGPTAPAHRSRCSRVSPRLTSSRTVGRPRRRSGSRAAISRGASSRSARAITGRGGGPSASWSHSISRAQPSSRDSRSQSVASVSRSDGAAGRSSARTAYRPRSRLAHAAAATGRLPDSASPQSKITGGGGTAAGPPHSPAARPATAASDGGSGSGAGPGEITGVSSPCSRWSRQGMPVR